MTLNTSRQSLTVFLSLWKTGTSPLRAYVCEILVSCLITLESCETAPVRITGFVSLAAKLSKYWEGGAPKDQLHAIRHVHENKQIGYLSKYGLLFITQNKNGIIKITDKKLIWSPYRTHKMVFHPKSFR